MLARWRHLPGRLLRLGENVGQHAAVQAGLRHARGELVVVMDADLQDSPEDVPRLLTPSTPARRRRVCGPPRPLRRPRPGTHRTGLPLGAQAALRWTDPRRRRHVQRVAALGGRSGRAARTTTPRHSSPPPPWPGCASRRCRSTGTPARAVGRPPARGAARGSPSWPGHPDPAAPAGSRLHAPYAAAPPAAEVVELGVRSERRKRDASSPQRASRSPTSPGGDLPRDGSARAGRHAVHAAPPRRGAWPRPGHPAGRPGRRRGVRAGEVHGRAGRARLRRHRPGPHPGSRRAAARRRTRRDGGGGRPARPTDRAARLVRRGGRVLRAAPPQRHRRGVRGHADDWPGPAAGWCSSSRTPTSPGSTCRSP